MNIGMGGWKDRVERWTRWEGIGGTGGWWREPWWVWGEALVWRAGVQTVLRAFSIHVSRAIIEPTMLHKNTP